MENMNSVYFHKQNLSKYAIYRLRYISLITTEGTENTEKLLYMHCQFKISVNSVSSVV